MTDEQLTEFCFNFGFDCNDCPFQNSECDEFLERYDMSPIRYYEMREGINERDT